MNIQESMEDLWSMETLLEADFFYALALMQRSVAEEAPRRIAIRSAFAYLEGQLFSLKKTMEQMATEEKVTLSEKDIESVNEAKAKGEKKKMPLSENLLFSLKLAKRVARSDHVIDTDGAGYRDLITAIGIRDRLMHPKSKDQLSVGIAEVLTSQRGVAWFHDQFAGILASRGRAKENA